MPTDNGIQLVVFDLGRVLIRLCDDFKHACRVANVPVEIPQLDEATRQRFLELIYRSETGRLPRDAFLRAVSAIVGLEMAHVGAMMDAFLLTPFPGASALVAELCDRGFQTACLTNTNAEHWQFMNDPSHPSALPLHRMTHRFASHLLGLRKPDDAIYEQVERQTNLSGDQILFFDDIAENVDAAARRGWRVHRVERCGDTVPQLRRHLVENGVLES
jgi:putative hydrolase of the HAD superfamily